MRRVAVCSSARFGAWRFAFAMAALLTGAVFAAAAEQAPGAGSQGESRGEAAEG
jgi:hypothetical protein